MQRKAVLFCKKEPKNFYQFMLCWAAEFATQLDSTLATLGLGRIRTPAHLMPGSLRATCLRNQIAFATMGGGRWPAPGTNQTG
jgi:hypothetical protein